MGESHRDGALLERGAELAGLDGLLAAACAGRGALIVIEGPPGIGKSALLGACAERAAALGMQCLRARGDDVSMESSFAAMRELLAPAAGPDAFRGSAGLAAPVFRGEADAAPEPDRAAAVLHGLYWLIADHCDRGPVALLVDDAHWLDPASVRFLLYLARRLESLPAVLVVGQRRGEVSRPL
ncbi:MAG TPA: ATP-binding protein, partial [Solirubrobacteraceae bacterium]